MSDEIKKDLNEDLLEENETYPVMPLRNTVLFPQQVIPIYIGRDKSLKLINELPANSKHIVVVAQEDGSIEDPNPDEMYSFGTLAVVLKVFDMPDNSKSAIVQGIDRVKILDFKEKDPYYRAVVQRMSDTGSADDIELDAMAKNLRQVFSELIQVAPNLSEEHTGMLSNIQKPARLADRAVSLITVSNPEKQDVLEELDIKSRVEKSIKILTKEIQRIKLGEEIQTEVHDEIAKSQREYYLREQMKAIKRELGEDESQVELKEVEDAIKKAKMPKEAEKVALKELDRLSKIPSQSPEYTVSRTYLDWLTELPWSKKSEDSITLTIKNKRQNKMPISLFTLNNDSIISKLWIDNILGEKTITIPRNNANKLVLNYDKSIPEYKLRDNWKSLKGYFFNNKPLQFRLFKDVEDPNYSQVFLMPLVEFNNIYDGFTLGAKLYNKTLIRKGFNYKFSPKYGLKSKTLTGSASIIYTQNIENKDLYKVTYGFVGGTSSYAPNLLFRKITPFVTFSFRNHINYRSNKFQALNFRYIDISRDDDINNISDNAEPDYKIFNARYINTNPGLINYYKWFTDFQVSKDFGKLSFNYEYRKLYESNRQLNVRFFTGVFLYNNNPSNTNYFSFALDRPTDYLFEYNYLGRSESSGIFSQQLIIAEGGFKSKLETPFSNQWISTFNLSTTLWKYIQAYGDIGLVKNKYQNAKFVYDSGIRLNLVTDYFEVYFPIYSNLGWEIGNRNYDQRIRFIFTVDPEALLGLFRREWY